MRAREIRRARPLLGTFVEVCATGSDETLLENAVERAFRVIERLQSRLSSHDAASEVTRLNRDANRQAIAVSRDLWRVLRTAVRLSHQCEGAFDVTSNPASAPRHRERAGSFRDIGFLPGRRIRFGRPLRVDLGGIAKGYCVDQAVRELERCGVESGLVNAGGDLRAFGDRPFTLHLRHPGEPGRILPWAVIRNAAIATSASYLSSRRRWAGRMLDGRSSTPIGCGLSVTVLAPRGVIADALTKVVAVAPERAAPLLASYQARAWIATSRGTALRQRELKPYQG
jgi:thiamine biosynthesis lipoprotein